MTRRFDHTFTVRTGQVAWRRGLSQHLLQAAHRSSVPEIRQATGNKGCCHDSGGTSWTTTAAVSSSTFRSVEAVEATSHAFLAEGFDLVATLDIRNYLARNAHHD